MNTQSDLFAPVDTLEQAKREVIEAARSKSGTTCPCCGQYAKVYNRTINSTMARQLITAYKKHGKDWFHTRDVVLVDSAGAGDFSKLEYWELIRRKPHTRGDKGKASSGMWQITHLGLDFVKGLQTVPEYAVIYNSKLLELTGGDVHIKDTLGNKFDYRELMGYYTPHSMAGS